MPTSGSSNSRWKLAGLSAAVLIVLALSAFVGRFVLKGYALCHPGRSHVSAVETTRARESLAGLEDVSLETRDGVTLRGWFVPPRNGTAVIFTHGLYANRGLLLPEAEVFARHGYGLLLYDSRAHGESGGSVATWGSTEAFDIADCSSFVRTRPGVSRVAVLGFSVGASSTSRAAANDPRIAAVILYATWTSLREEVRYKAGTGGWLGAQGMLLGMRLAGVQIDEITPATDMARIAPRPVMMLSGGQDEDTPPWVMDRMFALTASPKEFWREPSVGHGGYFEAAPTEYERRVLGFLDRALR